MTIQCYFKALRNPAKGGLHISETSKDFPEAYRECIERNCLELISVDYERNACAVYPTRDGRFIVMVAKKNHGTKLEPRPHETICGVVVSEKEFRTIYRNHMAQANFDEVFFPEQEKDADEGISQLGEFKKRILGHQLINLYTALRETIMKRRKIHLIVPKGMERVVQAACYDVLSREEKKKLFVISNGECTLSEADILITDQIQYQDYRKYNTMTLEEFISYGAKASGNRG